MAKLNSFGIYFVMPSQFILDNLVLIFQVPKGYIA